MNDQKMIMKIQTFLNEQMDNIKEMNLESLSDDKQAMIIGEVIGYAKVEMFILQSLFDQL